MKIAKVEAEYLAVSVNIPVTDKPVDLGALLVTIETDTGIRGIGMAREREWHCIAVRGLVEHDIAPILIGMDPMSPEHVWSGVTWEAASRGEYSRPVGVVSRAVSAVDQALWDIRGKYLNQPVYRLLGGAHLGEVDVYITFGMNTYTPEEEAEAARRLVAQGHDAFKLMGAWPERGPNVEHDAARVKALREIAGDSARIMLDGRGRLPLSHAILLAKQIEPYNVAFLDEPVLAKDPQAMKELRHACPSVPIAARGSGDIRSNRDLITLGAVDVMGSNVMDQGGYTQSIKIAHMAEMYGLPLVTGGAYHLQNAHLIAAVSNGWMTECFVLFQQLCEAIFVDPVKPKKGKLSLGDKPGLGLQLNDDAVREAVERGRVAERSGVF